MATYVVLLWGLPACGFDGGKPDSGDRCAAPGAPLIECGPAPLTGAEDACWHLVQCGAIPAANPDSDPSCCFDWAACVAHVDGLPDPQFEMTLACIETTACDELRSRGRAAHLHAGAAPASAFDLPGCVD